MVTWRTGDSIAIKQQKGITHELNVPIIITDN